MKSKNVIKHVLENGLTVLVRPNHAIPKVSTQLWYNVGSKDEKTGERGIAHFIEHMIFKGTKKLSECDINLITHKLSGYTNAYTSYDYTGYLFDFPSQQWQPALAVLADCMRNCTFKEPFINSEVKAVIQELKLYKDDYISSCLEALVSSIFSDHPYHHPIIGYKHDLWSLERESLVNFYEKHYIPNNATLVVVGDVNPDEVVHLAKKEFSHIEPNWDYKKEKYNHSSDLRATTITLYRDVTLPQFIFAWTIPGASTGNDYLINVLSSLIGSGQGSRLYKKLVNELQLLTDLDAFTYDLFDYALFFIYAQPKDGVDKNMIKKIIAQELEDLAHNIVSTQEIGRAIKRVEAEHVSLLENNQKQAYAIGKFFLATGDAEYVYTYTQGPKDHLAFQIKELVEAYVRPSLMHEGSILPIASTEKEHWKQLQEASDREDEQILSRKERTIDVESGRCVLDIHARSPKPFSFPESYDDTLSNGLKILYTKQSHVPKIDIIIDFKAKHYYDPVGKEGLAAFVGNMLLEGTKNYPSQKLIDTIESHGMSMQSSAGSISLSLLANDLPIGLELLNDILTQSLFSPDAIEKVRGQMLADLSEFWDTPSRFVSQLVRQEVYGTHPYSKNLYGTIEGVHAITRDDLIAWYKKFYSPRAARMALAGDLHAYDVKKLIEEKLHAWKGDTVADIDFPTLSPVTKHELAYPILRDQTVLCYAGLSVSRLSSDYDKLLLFDQIFSGGILNSMASRLFDLRERSGLFYTIGGALLSGSDLHEGVMRVRTVVSNDRLAEAEKAIESVINTAIDTLSNDEMAEARNVLVNSLSDNFATTYQTAATLLFKDIYGFSKEYFETRPAQLAAISKEDVQKTVKKYLSTDAMVTIRIGRV